MAVFSTCTVSVTVLKPGCSMRIAWRPGGTAYSTTGVWPTSTPSMYTSPNGLASIVRYPCSAAAGAGAGGGGAVPPRGVQRCLGVGGDLRTQAGSAATLGGCGHGLLRPHARRKLFHRGVAVVGLLGHGARQGGREELWQVGPARGGARGLLEDVLVEDGVDRIAGEGQLASHRSIADDTERVLG